MVQLQLSRRTILVEGMPVVYKVVGEGEPIVFVHGLTGSTIWWRRNIADLATRYQLYLVDLPGFGAMHRYHRHFYLAQMAEWLAGWAQVAGLETFHLVGHSMGGYVCMDMAVRYPEKVKRLVLVDSIGTPFNRSAAGLVPHALLAIVRTTPAFWPFITCDILRAGTPMIMRAGKQIAALDAGPVVASVTTPTLLIWGERDDLVPLAFGKRLRENLAAANVRLLILKNANHFSMFEQPRLFNASLLAFLDGESVGD